MFALRCLCQLLSDMHISNTVSDYQDEATALLVADDPENEGRNAGAAGYLQRELGLQPLDSLAGENPLSLFVRSLMPWVGFEHGSTFSDVAVSYQTENEDPSEDN